MKYPCLENTDNDTHKRNYVLWGDIILEQHKTKRQKELKKAFGHLCGCRVYIVFQQSLSTLETVK